jgi:dTDP-4-dehydrorhamnose reductase
MMGPILLLGSTGQVGWELQRSLAPLGELIALERSDTLAGRGCGDLLDLQGLRETIRRIRPRAIVNAAAYTRVDDAEHETGIAHAVNALAPGAMAEMAAELGAWLVHFSTDYVFDGSGSAPWSTSAGAAPLSAYGRTKWEGEQRVRAAAGVKHLIFRTSWVYAARGGNFAKTMLRLGQERESLRVIDDQVGAPTGADLIADVTAHALRQVQGDPGLSGTYHLAAQGETSWFGYARFVLDTARALAPELPLKAQDIVPIPSSAYATAARRPLNSRLDTSGLREAFGLTLPDWRIGVRRMLQEVL